MTIPTHRTPESSDWPTATGHIERFRRLWIAGNSPELTAALPPSGSPERIMVLCDLLPVEWEFRCRRGEAVRLEDALTRFPELGKIADLPVRLIHGEYSARLLHGDRPTLESYRLRFPKQYDALVRIVRDASPPRTSSPTPGMSPTLAAPNTVAPATALPDVKASLASPIQDDRKYVRLNLLGQGQFGEVYRARAPGGVEVAIKIIKRSLDDESSKRELAALEVVRHLRHPFLLETQAFWVEDGHLHIVMQLADDGLLDWFAQCRDKGLPGIPAPELVKYFQQASEALDFLHSVGAVHRDIKPANLMRVQGYAKVTDFGLVREQEANLAEATFCGTPLYMAPEGWSSRSSFHSDQYSLAATYVEMRTGHPSIRSASMLEMARQHLEGEPELDGLEPREREVLLRALAKKPGDRYPSCLAFADALAEALQVRATVATGESRGYRLLDRIGCGQYGEVFRAEAPGGVAVAIKRSLQTLDDASSRRELTALELVRELRHPFLLETQAFWQEEGRLYIVMQLADDTLAEWCARCVANGNPGVPVAELIPFFGQAAEALDFLHLNKVLHRDIKPANLLRLQGYAKVADFGLARAQPIGQAASTLCGTPLYMAPEVWREEVCAQSDQYSLAVAYAEMRTGHRICDASDPYKLFQFHQEGEPDLAGMTSAEQEVVKRALSKDPAQRFPSCRAFTGALARALQPRSVSLPARYVFAAMLVGLLLSAGAYFLLPYLRSGALVASKSKTSLGTITAVQTEEGPWLPAGFEPDPGASLKKIDDRLYHGRIRKSIPGVEAPVVFLLIPPQAKSPAVPAFYIMRDKVTNAQFEAASADKRMQGYLRAARKTEPWSVPATWRKYAAEAGSGALPVMGVSVTEANLFARWLDEELGRLPSVDEWDKAAGRFDDVKNKGPFDSSRALDDIAIGVRGPRPAGASLKDISFFGCRDMAGNGCEWTRETDRERKGGGNEEVPLANPRAGVDHVRVRGAPFDGQSPYQFADVKLTANSESYEEASYCIGFRVVIELPVDQ